MEGYKKYTDEESQKMARDYLKKNWDMLSEHIGKYALIVDNDLVSIHKEEEKLMKIALKEYTNRKLKAIIKIEDLVE